MVWYKAFIQASTGPRVQIVDCPNGTEGTKVACSNIRKPLEQRQVVLFWHPDFGQSAS
jgi:hypothetical protein